MTEEIDKISQQQENKGDNIFIANPEPPRKVRKNTVLVAVVTTIIFIIVGIVVIMLSSLSAGNETALKYEREARKQISGLQVALDILKPDQVVNNRNLEPILQKLEELRQPKLNNVFFASTFSFSYREAEETNKKVQKYYGSLRQYIKDAMLSVDFSNQMNKIQSSQKEAVANIQTGNASSLRSLSGTFGKFEQQILDSSAPAQFQDLQAQIAELYDEQADNYQNWAEAIEQNKPEEIVELQKDIAKNNKDIESLTSDTTYTEQFEASYKSLQKQQKTLEKRLNS